MIAFDLASYQPADTLYLWWLANPDAPRLIGELHMARALNGVSLVYAASWLRAGFALSEDLPLMPGEFFPRDRETAAGALDDARPDRWGDHEKNHVLLMADSGEYELSPAFDVLPSGQSLGYQQMRVGAFAADATLENALSEHRQFGLYKDAAVEQVKNVSAVVATWKKHFTQVGVAAADIASLAGQIDRPFLLNQRRAFLR